MTRPLSDWRRILRLPRNHRAPRHAAPAARHRLVYKFSCDICDSVTAAVRCRRCRRPVSACASCGACPACDWGL